ncbi:MAG: hypothetical protein E6G10_14805 [Actinobacteria bacterium]|nr:MAG: hypothetical protein E6G10_14805 [Actinomycetota bacterium]
MSAFAITVPFHAICNVVQADAGLVPPLAAATIRREHVDARDVEGRAVLRGARLRPDRRLHDHHRVVRVQLARELVVGPDQPLRARRVRRRVVRLVDPFVGAEAVVLAEPGRDLAEERFLGGAVLLWEVRHALAEVEPAVDPVLLGVVEAVLDDLELLVDQRLARGRIPRLRRRRKAAEVARADADEVPARRLQLLERVDSGRRLPVDGRRLREPDREELASAHHQDSGLVDGDRGHVTRIAPRRPRDQGVTFTR